ncbi:MAG: ATPase, T2SS/T4P/T4SS family [Candidatus Eremiobacteraeota bacterium]|nr:ATPase, T2SS/T4P/T4SS family [Candidatus Eremiobacteraeota bacterium]
MDQTSTKGTAPDNAEMEAKARSMRVPFVDISQVQLDKEVAMIIPESMARRYSLVCIDKKDKKITLGMADPLDVFAIDDVRFRTGYDVESVLTRQEDIESALDYVYGEDTSWKEVISLVEDTSLELKKEEEGSEEEVVIDQPVIRLVNMIITQAIEKKASDIHIEPFEGELLIRYRIDGILHEVMTTPKSLVPAVISRIKIMAGLKLDEKRIPQDGRIHMKIRDRDLDLRVSTCPSLHGEDVVMRLLDKKSMQVDLTKLGFRELDFANLNKLVSRPNGCFLVTGPTGSGKTTTLYSALNKINQPDIKILTVEDPIEYNLKGIIQVQTHARVGLTFASALRAFLRQDPDIIMVGEIRDKETATIAIEAALTGHLVLSTLHTNDSIGSVTRLTDMGVERFLISSTMLGALAQRLARTVCDACAEPRPLHPELKKLFEKYGIQENDVNMRIGAGCHICNMTGYKGRMGIYELMVVDDEIRAQIVNHASAKEMEIAARKSGFIRLFEDGLMKVAQGRTTYEDLCRITAD